VIIVVGVSHRTAPLEIRERYAVSTDQMPALLARLSSLPGNPEVLLLSTCNRVEAMLRPTLTTPSLAELATLAKQVLYEHARQAGNAETNLYAITGDAAIRHVFRVTSSLDSLVVGEPQILGQVKQAAEFAKASGTLRGLLARSVDRAFTVAKRVRTETEVGAGTVSVSSVAVDLARHIFGGLGAHTVLLVGAGEMAESAARALGKEARGIRVCNRSIERAAELASQFGGSASSLETLEDELVHADIVVTSTASQSHIVSPALVKRVMRARKGRTLFLVDISVPRNVSPDVHEIDNVYVYNVDDLERQAAGALSARGSEVTKAEQIVESEVANFHKWLRTLDLQPMIVSFRARTHAVLTSELERSLGTRLKHLPEADRAALSQMIESATNKLVHAPIAKLKEKAEAQEEGDFVRTLAELFELGDPGASSSAASDANGDESARPRRVTH
jgi:glutamyl-tRNA reductase